MSAFRPGAALTAVTVALVLLLVLLCTACGAGKPPAPPPPRPQPVLSRYETATGRVIVRDCGYSVPLPGRTGQSLWLFCDTLVTSRQGNEIGEPILGTGTAAEGPYQAGRAPDALTEVTTPGQPAAVPVPVAPASDPASSSGKAGARSAPQPFLAAPAEVTLPDSMLPCTGPQTYPARWFTGIVREPAPSSHLLISYLDYCVTGSTTYTAEAFGLIDYDPAGNVLASPAQVFSTAPGQQLPAQWQLGSPVFRGGYLYLFASCAPQQGCGTPGVFLIRTGAGPAWWQDGLTYQYWTGKAWSPSPASAVPLAGHPAPLAVSAGDFTADGHGLVLVEQTSLAGGFSVWQAAAPAGPWHRIETGRVPCPTGKQPGANELCRALIGHPELSTHDELMISFFDPGKNHVMVIAYPW